MLLLTTLFYFISTTLFNFISATSDPSHRLIRKWAVQLKDPITKTPFSLPQASNFAKTNGFLNLGKISNFEGYYLFETVVFDKFDKRFNDDGVVLEERWNDLDERWMKRSVGDVEVELAKRDDVHWVEIQVPKRRVKRSLDLEKSIRKRGLDDDYERDALEKVSYFKDPQFHNQWHLYNDGVNGNFEGNDINVIPVWKMGINGTGVTVSVIDDGVDFNHTDLIHAFSKESSFDFTARDSSPYPGSAEDNHGTRCAGEIAAKENNGVCGVGVAFGAKLSGIRLIAETTLDAIEASAFNFKFHTNDIYSASWGPNDDGETLDGPGTLGQMALQEGTNTGRNGLGSVFVFASGNGGRDADNCNFDGYASSIYTVSVGAISNNGGFTYYGEMCSAHLAVTYSGGVGVGITTTDLDNGCTDQHSGTSAAAPIASGMIALALSIRPDLSWRDIQQLIIESTQINDPRDSGWTKNGVGRLVSHKYGYGSIDAKKLIDNTITHQLLPSPSLKIKKDIYPNQKIVYKPSHSPKFFTSKLNIDHQEFKQIGLKTLEHVQVTLRITHPNRSHLKITLISPLQTRSVLATQRPKDLSKDGFNPWTFMTVHSWGEDPFGTWTLEIEDGTMGKINAETMEAYPLGTLVNWKLVLHGVCGGEDVVGGNGTVGGKTCGHSVKSAQSRRELVVGVVGVGVFLVLVGVLYFLFRKIQKARLQKRGGYLMASGDEYDDDAPMYDDVESPMMKQSFGMMNFSTRQQKRKDSNVRYADVYTPIQKTEPIFNDATADDERRHSISSRTRASTTGRVSQVLHDSGREEFQERKSVTLKDQNIRALGRELVKTSGVEENVGTMKRSRSAILLNNEGDQYLPKIKAIEVIAQNTNVIRKSKSFSKFTK